MVVTSSYAEIRRSSRASRQPCRLVGGKRPMRALDDRGSGLAQPAGVLLLAAVSEADVLLRLCPTGQPTGALLLASLAPASAARAGRNSGQQRSRRVSGQPLSPRKPLPLG